MPPTPITHSQCAAILVEWLRRHCNSEQLKATSKAIEYKYSIFSPLRKLHLLEEMTFLYVGLAIRATNTALTKHSTIEAVIDEFLSQLRKSLLNFMAKDDPQFSQRYSERMGVYFEQLRANADPIGVAGDFLVFVFASPHARLNFEPVVQMASTISAALQSLQQLLGEFEVSDAEPGLCI